jgi:hypothetical protein
MKSNEITESKRTDTKWHKAPQTHFHGGDTGSNPVGDAK